MFGRQKEEHKAQESEKPQTKEDPSIETKSSGKIDQLVENRAPLLSSSVDLKGQKTQLVKIKEYSSAMEIAEKIDKAIVETKSALGQYLRQMDNARGVAEKIERLHALVAKATDKRLPKENPNQLEIEGLEIIIDATPLDELAAIETVVKTSQQRLMTLQETRESMGSLDKLCEIDGLKYLVLEKEGIPEQILLRIS